MYFMQLLDLESSSDLSFTSSVNIFSSDCETLDLEDILGQGTDGVKNIGQQLLLLQNQVSVNHQTVLRLKMKISQTITTLLLCLKLKQEKEEKRKIVENYTLERTLRKKYYNMVEDMKGKRDILQHTACLCI